jgi:hypothetical protein
MYRDIEKRVMYHLRLPVCRVRCGLKDHLQIIHIDDYIMLLTYFQCPGEKLLQKAWDKIKQLKIEKKALKHTDQPKEILLNPSVKPPDEIRLEGYCKAMFHLFVERYHYCIKHPNASGVSTSEIIQIGKAQYQARLSELRRALIPLGWCIDRVSGEGSVFFYKMVELNKSTFYQKRKDHINV